MALTASFILTAIAALATVIGISFAITSVYAYLQVDKKIDARFQLKYEEHRNALDVQSGQWASGIRLWTQAQMIPDVVQAAMTMESALAAWPSIPGARLETLERLYGETEQAYMLDLIPNQRWAKTLHLIRSSAPAEYVPDRHISDCLIWLTRCDEHERHIDSVTIDWLGAKIYAMNQEPEGMFRRLENLPESIAEPDEAARLILLSGIHSVSAFDRLDAWWTRRFGHTIATDVVAWMEEAKVTLNGMSQPWLVIPKHIMSKTSMVEIAQYGESGWSIQWREKQDQHLADNMEELLSFVSERWILCAPVPRS